MCHSNVLEELVLCLRALRIQEAQFLRVVPIHGLKNGTKNNPIFQYRFPRGDLGGLKE